jgi:hypothetical protein
MLESKYDALVCGSSGDRFIDLDASTRRKFCPPKHWYLDDPSLTSQFFDFDDLATYQDASDEEDDQDRSHTSDFSMTNVRNTFPASSAASSSDKKKQRRIILRKMPFLIPFDTRVELFHQLVKHDTE